ncbi:TPR-like protein [Meredithblackwellia eburnea MCA 4105]
MSIFPSEVTSFQPKASTSTSAIFDFPLDPALLGVGSDGLGGPRAGDASGYEDSFDEDSQDGLEEDDEEDEEEEQHVHLGRRGGLKSRKPVKVDRKGKGRAVDHDSEDEEEEGDDDEQEYPDLEEQDSQELGRLIHAIRDSATSTVGGRTVLDKEFDRSIEEELRDLDEDHQGKGKGKGKRSRPRRPRPQPEPSAEVRSLLGQANSHYVLGSHNAAISLLTEVVRIDPTLRGPWYTLATIYDERGELEKSVGFKIVAAHLEGGGVGQAGVWADLGAQSRDIGLLQQAIYCFSQAIKNDKNDLDSMWDRAVLLKLSGSTKQAITAFNHLLTIHPHDPGVLRELVPLLVQSSQTIKATNLYLASLSYFQEKVPHFNPLSEEDVNAVSSFNYEDLESLADLLLLSKQYLKTISILKSGVRWLQGRSQEEVWEEMTGDDREYDLERKWRTGWERESRFVEEAGVNELDVRLRTRLGVARLKEGKVDEAQIHFGIALREDVSEFPELFGAIADAYLESKMFSEALDVYQDMAENEETNGSAVWIKVAQCNLELGDLDQAKECYEAVVEDEPENHQIKLQLARVYEQMGEAAIALQLINEVIEARRSQKGYVEDAPGGSRRSTGTGTGEGRTGVGFAGLGASAPRRRGRPSLASSRRDQSASRAELEAQRQQEFLIAYTKLASLDALVSTGDQASIKEWLEVATFLVDNFRETRQLFPSSTGGKKKFRGMLSRRWRRKGVKEDLESQADEMVQRLERTMDEEEDDTPPEVDSFRGKDFDGWLTLIIRYAFLLTENDEAEAGDETLAHVEGAIVFRQSPQRMLALKLARVSCFLHAGKTEEALVQLRAIWIRHQLQSQPLRLVYGIFSSGKQANDALTGANFQKFLTRQLRQIDDFVRGVEGKKTAGVGREGSEQAADEDEMEEENRETGEGETGSSFKPTRFNPLFYVTYGVTLLMSRSYQSAIIYLLRAYDIDPQQPLVNFSLGIAYLHRAMNRQTDNRQHQIAQAMGFFSQYRKLRGPCQEVEYNFGRFFHQIGLQSYAIKHYEATLRLAGEERLAAQAERMNIDDNEEESDAESSSGHQTGQFARLAAYNLSMLYVQTGSEDVGRSTAARWLSF